MRKGTLFAMVSSDDIIEASYTDLKLVLDDVFDEIKIIKRDVDFLKKEKLRNNRKKARNQKKESELVNINKFKKD